MTYKINKTDGSVLTDIIDSAIDQTATDLTLIGKNVTGYGEYINENFVKLLENFASSTAPNFPITGQVWYDLIENRLKVYDGNGFKVGNGPVVAPTQPATLTQGDFWIDNLDHQLYFHDGISLYPASKIWKTSQGKSGFEVKTIKDQYSNDKTVVLLWSAGVLLGIFSHYAEFTPQSASGTIFFDNSFYTGVIYPGFNPNSSIENFKFNVIATKADSLVDAVGELKVAEDFVLIDQANELTFNEGSAAHSLSIASPYPLKLGATGEASILVGPHPTDDFRQFQIKSNYPGQNFVVTSKDLIGDDTTAIIVDASTGNVGIFNDLPQATLDVGGDAIVNGILTVTGPSVRLPTSTTSERDARTAEGQAVNGEIIYNSSTHKVQAYANGIWVDLH